MARTICEELKRRGFHHGSEIRIAFNGSYVFEGEYGLTEKGAIADYENYLYVESYQMTANGPFIFYIREAE